MTEQSEMFELDIEGGRWDGSRAVVRKRPDGSFPQRIEVGDETGLVSDENGEVIGHILGHILGHPD